VRHLVDLPGYGYAKVSGDLKRHWHGLIQTYLDRRQALSGVVVVMDIRHPLKDSDIELIEWAGSRGLPLHLILTKADKLGRGKQKEALDEIASNDRRTGRRTDLFGRPRARGWPSWNRSVDWFGRLRTPATSTVPASNRAGSVRDRAAEYPPDSQPPAS
jgi:hypothetical protein